jgi:hypothetical protein
LACKKFTQAGFSTADVSRVGWEWLKTAVTKISIYNKKIICKWWIFYSYASLLEGNFL